MAQRFSLPYDAVFDGSGDPRGGALLNFYITGTLTRKDTYTDTALTSANANPVVADSSGRWSDIFLKAGDYRVVLTDSDSVEIWDSDPVTGLVGTAGAVLAKSGAYTVVVGDSSKIIEATATAAFTITLLAAATAGDAG